MPIDYLFYILTIIYKEKNKCCCVILNDLRVRRVIIEFLKRQFIITNFLVLSFKDQIHLIRPTT